MVRADAFNLHVEPVRTKMDGTQEILILYVCDSDERKPKGIIADEILSRACYMDKSKSESIIVNESSFEESESESVHKSINTNNEKYEMDEK